jgi:2-C-methyl-D-erythritol 4-phosphate cytidylyltransferase
MFDVILLAAGIGLRAGLDYPKQFYLLGGKPIMIYSLELFESMEEVSRIIVASRDERINKHIDQYKISKAVVVEGGETRQESVKNALVYCQTDRVIIHEAVRPFITKEHVRELLSIDDTAVIPIESLNFTLYDTSSELFPSRDTVFNVQLPQVFDRRILSGAHFLADKTYTDDSSLLKDVFGISPAVIKGLEHNIKITTPLDFRLAEAILYGDSGCNRGQ